MARRVRMTYLGGMSDIASRFHDTGRLRMHALECGDPSMPLVVLLHGFPESSASWREVMPKLADAGFFCVAPDLRGYGETERPDTGYDLDSLAEDVVALVRSLGREQAHVVGHDWGGLIAFHLAATRPESVDRLVVVNAPHPADVARRIWNPRQLVRSWYVLFFQLPLLPELLLSLGKGAVIPRLVRGAAKDRTNFTRERLATHRRTFETRRGAAKAVDYYRVAGRRFLLREKPWRKDSAYPRIRAPFRMVWGTEDVALRRELATGLDRWFESPPDVRFLEGVGHFVPLEAPGPLATLVAEHLRA